MNERNTYHLSFMRIWAFLIDYLIILGYISILIVVSLVFFSLSGKEPTAMHPFHGQLIGFVTLTLPVFLYFYLSENGKHSATVGKRKMGLKVASYGTRAVIWRNVLKFLPWEIAHTGVHWIIYYALLKEETPVWILAVLILSQLMALVFLLSIFWTSGKSSLYDFLAGTMVENTAEKGTFYQKVK